MEHPKTTKNIGQPCVICGQPANLQRALDAERERARVATQLIIETIGSSGGPEDLEEALGRMTAKLATLQAQLRHMTKERDIQKEVADNQAWHVRQLRQAIEHVHKAWAAKTPHEFHAWFAQNVALARAAQIEEGE